MGQVIADLSSKRAMSRAVSGGKGAGLAWLLRQGFSVPPGFVITAQALRTAPGADPSLPGPVERAICGAYHRLGGGRVAVRSSLIAEDTAATSFAGQLDTFLDVEGKDALLDAVRRCRGALYGERALAYAAQNALDPGQMAMALVVQRMVQPVAAGVAFSADPMTGEAQVVIEAAAGQGDAVVGGTVAVDRFIVDARGVLVEESPARPGEPALTEPQALELAGIVRQVERSAGCPQDVEWAWDGAAFHLLQSRPITTLAGCHVYSRRVVGEMAPGLIKPLVYAVNIESKSTVVFGRLFTELLGTAGADTAGLIPLFYSRAYGDMTLMGRLFERAGLPANAIEMMYQEEGARRGRMKMGPWMLPAMGRLARFGYRQRDLAARSLAETAQRSGELEAYRRRDWADVAAGELVARLDALIARRDEDYWLFFLVTLGMLMRTGALSRWTRRTAPDVSFSDLVRGLTGLKGLEPMAEIGQMAEVARALPPADLALLADGDDAAIRRRLDETDAGRALAAQVDAFITRHGYLSSNGSDFSVPVWAETPSVIWRAVSRAVALPAAAAAPDAATVRAETVRSVRARMHPVVCPAFDRLLDSTLTYVDRRERASLLMSEYSYQIRRICLEIAARLVAAGDLREPDDLFYLTHDELKALLDGALDVVTAGERVAVRKAEMAADAECEPPDVLRGDFQRARPAIPIETPGAVYLSGIGGSSGVAQGRARLVRDPADAPALLDREDILVVPYSDVGWTPLFPGVAAVVAETGGQLSHTAIVAREYGLPAVVSVKGAMRLIRDGQPLMVDGDRGRVYLESHPV